VKKNIKASVIIPTYNRALELSRSIASVLNQTFGEFELVVVDDGSTDHTKDIINSFDDARIQYHYTPNQGAAAARNFGVQQARADIVAFLDSDDAWLPEKLAIQLPFTEKHGLSVAGCMMVRKNTETPYIPILKKKEDILFGCRLNPGTTLMCQRDFLLETPFDTSLKRFEDWDWFIQQYLKGNMPHIVPEILGRVYLRPGKPVDTLSSLDALGGKYKNLPPDSLKIFQAGLLVEKSSLFMWQKKYAKSFKDLMKAFWLYPHGFYALIPSLKRMAKLDSILKK
jgi:glycosyltransferase involved in cell wall biosynthesis